MYGQKITPVDVARVLSGAGVRYVLAGAHAVNAHTGKPRATLDVDILTDAPVKACEALARAFPHLTMTDSVVVTRFFDEGREAIDVMKAKPTPLFRRIVRLAQQVEIQGQPIPVPSPEGMLAMKFASMINPNRPILDRRQDAVDFARVVEAHPKLESELLAALGELLHGGGGDELVNLVEDARSGRVLEI